MKRILIADGNSVAADDFGSDLIALGYELVGTASSGKEAFDLAENLRPDLVCVRLAMGGSPDGIETGEWLHRRLGIRTLFLVEPSDGLLLKRAHQISPVGYVMGGKPNVILGSHPGNRF